ncbi:hypothetical protein [Kocuria sp. KH4]
MDETAWLGDFLGVRAETWLDFWLAVVPATIGGLFAVAVAFLAHRLGGRRERRVRNEHAAAAMLEKISEIADKGVKRAGPQFNRVAMSRVMNDWADTCVLPRRQAANLGIAVLLWMRVWVWLHEAHDVDEELPVVVYSRRQVLAEYEEAFFGIFSAWLNLTGRGKIAHWYFYDRTMAVTRDLHNRKVSLLAAARTPELNGRMSVKMYEAPPWFWRPLISAAEKLGRLERVNPVREGPAVAARAARTRNEVRAMPLSGSTRPTNIQQKYLNSGEWTSMDAEFETVSGMQLRHTVNSFRAQRNL